jgi:hypothetical protein
MQIRTELEWRQSFLLLGRLAVAAHRCPMPSGGCASDCNTANIKPEAAADAARRRSEHDPGTRAEAFRSGVQRMGSVRIGLRGGGCGPDRTSLCGENSRHAPKTGKSIDLTPCAALLSANSSHIFNGLKANSRRRRNGNFSLERREFQFASMGISPSVDPRRDKKLSPSFNEQRIVAARQAPKQMAAVTTDNLAVNT